MATKFYIFEVSDAALGEATKNWSDVPVPDWLEQTLREGTVTGHSLAFTPAGDAFITVTVETSV